MVDRSRMRERHRELSYVTGQFMTEHLLRVHKLFEGDLSDADKVAYVDSVWDAVEIGMRRSDSKFTVWNSG